MIVRVRLLLLHKTQSTVTKVYHHDHFGSSGKPFIFNLSKVVIWTVVFKRQGHMWKVAYGPFLTTFSFCLYCPLQPSRFRGRANRKFVKQTQKFANRLHQNSSIISLARQIWLIIYTSHLAYLHALPIKKHNCLYFSF